MAALGAHPRLAAMMLAARNAGRGGARRRSRRAAGGARSVARSRRAGGYRAAPGGDRRRRSGRRIAARCRASAVSPASIAGGCGCGRCAGGRRSGPAARRRVSRPHRAAARRARQLPAGRRRRRAAAARRSAGQRAAAGGRRAGDEGGGAHPAGGAARSRHAAGVDRITEQVETSFDPVSGAVLARRRRRFGALVLADRTEPADPAEIAAALARAVAADGLRPLPWTDAGAPVPGPGRADAQLEPDARLARSVATRR